MQDFRPPFSPGVRPPSRDSPKVAIWGPSPSIGFSGSVRLLEVLSVPGARVPAHKFHLKEIHKATTGAKSFKAPKSKTVKGQMPTGHPQSQAVLEILACLMKIYCRNYLFLRFFFLPLEFVPCPIMEPLFFLDVLNLNLNLNLNF